MRQLKLCVCLVFLIIICGFELFRTTPTRGQISQAALAAPTNLSATDNAYAGKIGLYWDAIRGATSYRIFRSSLNDAASAAEIGTTAGNSFFDFEAFPSQTTYYWVRAENGADVSDLSVPDQGMTTMAQQLGPVPPLQPPPAPAGNEVTAAKTYLGKVLFWDEQMSSTRTVSCGTCHHSGTGGTDPRSAATAEGSTNPGPDQIVNTDDDIRGSAGVPANNADGTYTNVQIYGLDAQVTGRRSMSYINAGYSPLLFWDGRATGVFRDPITNAIVLNAGGALESQVLGPPLSSMEMAHPGRSWNDVAARIAASRPLVLSPSVPAPLAAWIGSRGYPALFEEAFGTAEVTPARIALAIATFERSLYSDQTPFDLAVAGIAPLTIQEQRGRGIFNANSCNVCHAGSLFTDNSFRYIGVRPQNEDTGRFQVTGNNNNIGEFRTPGLRNVELRGSYFHNGQFTTLEQVVAFYNRGGDFNGPNKPNNLIRPLGLGPQQQADLVAFLKRPLTDPRVVAEAAPFDRPALYTESDRVPRIIGTGVPGTGGFSPQIKAVSPPIIGNPNFTISVTGAVGNASAVLVIDESDPGTGPQIPATSSFARITTTTQDTGAGTGWASVSIAIPDNPTINSRTFFGRWYIADAGAANGFSVSNAVSFTVFGVATATGALSVSGRVLSPTGRGVSGAVVTLTGPQGESRQVTTSSLGFYRFDGLTSSGPYSAAVSSKRFRFTPRNLDISTDITDLDFIGQE